MRPLWITILGFAIGPAAFGQLDANSISITASRSVILQPDTASFSVTVITAPDTSLDDVLAGLQGSGISARNFTGVFTVNRSLAWIFHWTVPIAQMKDTIASLSALELNYVVTGVQVSEAATPACPRSDLIADATAQARKLSAAAGLTVGRILAVSDNPPQVADVVPTLAGRSGSFSSFILGTPSGQQPLFPSPQFTCSLTVQFALGR
jgi:uncharacterized protein YggE